MFQVGGVIGTFVLGSIIDRFSFRALALVYFIAVFAVGAIGQLGHSVVFVTMAIFAAGFCVVSERPLVRRAGRAASSVLSLL